MSGNKSICYIGVTMLNLLSLFGCRHTSTVYEGDCQGHKLTFSVIERKNFPVNEYEGRLQVGNLPALKIIGANIDMDVPYDLTLYRGSPHQFFNADASPYRNQISYDDSVKRGTMLYVSPTACTPEAFNRYAACMKAQWQTIKEAADSSSVPFRPNLVGVVYAERTEFIHIFNGLRNGEAYFFEIAPDGYVRYRQGDYSSEEGTNLSKLVQMPGRKIYLEDGGPFTLETLRTYKDAAGKTMEDYFEIIPAKRKP